MDLTNLFTAQTQSPEQMVICIVLTDTSVQALLLGVSVSDTRVITQSTIIPYADQESLSARTDQALQDLGSGSEKINEVLFAVEDSWLAGGDVSPEHQVVLKKITDDLALKPLGFVVQSEALFQHYATLHPQFSAVLLIVASNVSTVQVVRQGRLRYSTLVGRSESITADLHEALARYVKAQEGEALPARIVCSSFVLTAVELKQLQQDLLQVSWGDQVRFVQNPAIDVLDAKQTVQAVAQQTGVALMSQISPDMQADLSQAAAPITESSDSEPAPPQSESEKAAPTTAPQAATSASSFGVPISSKPLAQEDAQASTTPGSQPRSNGSGFTAKLVGGAQPKRIERNPKYYIIGGVLAGLLVLIGFIFLYSVHLSQITAVLKPKLLTVNRDVQITLDPSAESTDTTGNRIPARTVTLDVTATEEVETTGIKIVGDQAKGRVILYNKTEEDKRLDNGAVLSVGDVQFTLDEEVVIPAAEVEERASGRTITFGEKEVGATAFQIGVEGNITKDTQLQVESFDTSTYSAQAASDFTGGSSREVRVVAEDDVTAIIQKARETMLLDANRQFAEQAEDGQFVISSETIELTSQSLSHELGVEADILRGTIAGTVTTLSYTAADLKPIATAALTTEVPEDYTIASEDPQILSEPVGNLGADTEIVIEASVSSLARPRYQEDQLKQDIRGKSLEEARSILERRESIERVTFVHHPAWVSVFVRSVPNAPARISVQQAEE